MEINKLVLCIRSLFNIGLKVFFLGIGKLLSTLIVLSYLIAAPNITLAKSKCDKWYSGSYSDTILWGRGSIQEIKACSNKVGINHRDYVGHTPLHSAIKHEDPKIENLKYLLGEGAKVNTYSKILGTHRTPLISAASATRCCNNRQKQKEIILLLVKYGADTNAKEESGKTALQFYTGNDAQVIAALNGSGSTAFKQDTVAGNTCSANPNLCTITELCTKTSRGSRKHIALAQKTGLNCGVVETAAVIPEKTSVTKTCFAKTPEVCSFKELCQRATRKSGGAKTWAVTSNGKAYVKEAKKRGLSCGATAVVKKVCSPEVCTNEVLCDNAAFKVPNNGISKYPYAWRLNPSKKVYVKEAKKRGLSCGAGNSGSSEGDVAAVLLCALTPNPEACLDSAKANKTYFSKSNFTSLSSLQRKQLQYGLKKLGYYTSSIDGAYGPNTQRAVRGYAAAKGITSGYPASVYNRIVREVNVPSSFAVAKRPSTSSSSSSSSNPSSSGPSLGEIFLGGAATLLVCRLTPNAAACLDGAMGNSSNGGSSSSSSNSSNPVSSSCNSNYDCAYSSVCIKKAGRGQCMELPRGTSRSNFNAIKCSGSYDCPSRSKCDRTYKICVKR